MQLTPLIAIHMSAALAAIAIGPLAIWARRSAMQRPKLHRAFGYAWVTLMLLAATSAIFLSGDKTPHTALFGLRFGFIHLLIPATYVTLFIAFWHLATGNISGHRRSMQGLYVGACGVAGAFTLLPNRYLGQLVWHQWLGLI
jgi:uncharacterized membrane protein